MGKQRPKFRAAGKFVQTYTPTKTVNYETLVKELFITNQCPMLDGEISVQVVAYLTIPQSAPKKKAEQMAIGNINPTKKPDCDNILKIVCDSLNGMAYRDDSQIVQAMIKKRYTNQTPRVEIYMAEAIVS
jgi:Holliday junction resolvase RusA-like endonuclease